MSYKEYSLNGLLRVLPEVFSYRQLGETLKVDQRQILRYLKKLVEEKRIVKIGKGMYAKADTDPFYVGYAKLRGHYSFSTALYLHGLKKEGEAVFYMNVNTAKKPFGFMGAKFQPVLFRDFFLEVEMKERQGRKIAVTTYPKTIFDMFHRPRHADFYCLYRALNWRPPKREEWETLLKLAKMAPLSTKRRLGFGLEGKAPRWFIRELEKRNKEGGVSFFVPGVARGYSKKWRVYEPNNTRRWLGEF